MKRWFRFQMRKFLKRPKDMARAAVINRRLAFCYLFLTWNALGICIYSYLKEEYPLTQSEKKVPALWYLRLMGEDHVDVVSIDGFTKKSHVRFDAASDTITPITSDRILSLDSIYGTEEEEVCLDS